MVVAAYFKYSRYTDECVTLRFCQVCVTGLSHVCDLKHVTLPLIPSQHEKTGEKALLLDHSTLGGRRIRVEPTAKGSGNGAGRQDAIKGVLCVIGVGRDVGGCQGRGLLCV